jgi:hypothetical protein
MTARLKISPTDHRFGRAEAMDIRKNKGLRIAGQALLVSLALATMIGGWIVIWFT